MQRIDIKQNTIECLEELKRSGVEYIVRPALAPENETEKDGKLETEICSSSTPPLNRTQETLNDLGAKIGDCKACGLSKTRNNIVFGSGNPSPKLVFVGEAPGSDEDMQGLPFVGRAGKLLTKIIESIGLKREDVYICNIIKCRPPENRNPLPDEIATCSPFLKKQIELLRPRVICALGTFAAQTLLETDAAISGIRGRFHEYSGRPFMPTYHPAYLLRNPKMKRLVWEDMKKIRELLEKN